MQARESFAAGRDGTRIWWREAGAGRTPVLCTDGVGCAGYVWDRLFPWLARSRRVLHWNYRGHGNTPPPADPARCTLRDCVDDVIAVLDAAGERRAVLAGHSMGVQVSLEVHRRAPERVAGLILLCGSPSRPLETFHGSAALGRVFPWLRDLVLAFPGLAGHAFRRLVPSELAMQVGLWLEVNRQLVRREDLRRYFDDLSRVDPASFVRLLDSAAEHDATDHLPAVDVPALVVGGERDTFTPLALSERMHRAIPGSEMLVLPAGSHMGPLEHQELVQLRLEKFLAERVDRRLRSVAPAPDAA
ncbi:MAG TPA: alpha/beta hydrolase [Anaeromyxobacteraceae bacterium]|jgi:pimeloyl-ACP methyl ester carboxylesterase